MTVEGAPRYHFVTRWRVEGDLEEVATLLFNAPDLPRWWPSVYLEITQLEQGDVTGVGSTVALHTKGWLPYHLRWVARTVEADLPHGYTLQATGDFVGRGTWAFRQDGPYVEVEYDWEIVVLQPLLRRLSFVARPLFGANHQWAMARGLESLRLELARQHAPSEAARAAVPPPPGSTPDVTRGMVAAGLAVAAALVLLWRRR